MQFQELNVYNEANHRNKITEEIMLANWFNKKSKITSTLVLSSKTVHSISGPLPAPSKNFKCHLKRKFPDSIKENAHN